ncbi:MAG: TRAP transporter large permease subunit [Rhodospirillum sp.]|nr:TRAP transporter large permease subunit [Rhodospirillum sp.]MCF8491782.1 TRAP transporter large permease subunit [Rhodospirillum sp.]MCF8501421.1 TRAP transporter large permease subunit [Rhodospirillum sp.]
MFELIAQNLAPIMFLMLAIFLLLGYPVAFSLAANGLLFFAVAVELAPLAPDTISLSWPLLQALPERVFRIMSNEALLAIPFFTFMGLILERSGMAEDLLDTMGHLFGTLRGGLAYAVIFVGALLAATTGVLAASVISMGLISLPIMLRYGYDRRLASGVIAASGTLAQIIPPSLVLIVMADQLGRSVGDMYEGAFLPAILLAGAYALYVLIVSLIFPKAAPGLPRDAIGHREPDGARGVWQFLLLAFLSGLVGRYMVADAGIKAGSDFVILTLCAGTIVALVSALLHRLCAGRPLAILIAITLVLAALHAWVHGQGHEKAVAAIEIIGSGAIYALLVALVERFTGLRLMSRMAEQATFVMVPPLLLIFLVLGTIFIGLATPTEGGAMGAVGAVVLAAIKRATSGDSRRFNATILTQATRSTAKLSSFVLFILIGASVFSLAFYGVNGHIWVEHLLTSLPGGQVGFLVVVCLVLFLLAFFLDFFELAFILLPLLAPVADKIGIDLIWFGVIVGLVMQTSFMHPPFGFALFFLRSVAAKTPYMDRITGTRVEPVTTGQIYWGAVPFIGIQLLMVLVVILFPRVVLHYKDGQTQLDPATVQEQLDSIPLPTLDPVDGHPPTFNFD